MTGHNPRLKLFQVDILISIAALDIVINRLPANNIFNYEMARKLLIRCQANAKTPFMRISPPKGALILQAIRLSLRAINDPRMNDEARSFIDKLERFVHHHDV